MSEGLRAVARMRWTMCPALLEANVPKDLVCVIACGANFVKGIVTPCYGH